MSLLREIQAALMEEGKDIGPILLKLRFLASRLGSDPLEEWVKHETEGYPNNIELPDYRKIGVSYTANFSGPFGSGITNAPIPPYLIDEHAGKGWTQYEIRQSVAAVDDLISGNKEGGGSLHINASNLILLLQGNVYKDYSCISVSGTISKAAMTELQYAVRTRVLELTIQLEKSVPTAAEITLGPLTTPPTVKDTEAVTQITQQIIHGNVTTISSRGESAQFHMNIGERDSEALVNALVKIGIGKPDATELAEIVASEEPESKEEPFGKQAKSWIALNIGKAVEGG